MDATKHRAEGDGAMRVRLVDDVSSRAGLQDKERTSSRTELLEMGAEVYCHATLTGEPLLLKVEQLAGGSARIHHYEHTKASLTG